MRAWNALSLVHNPTAERARHYYHSFHAYWDLDTVRNLTIGTPDEVPKEQRESVYGPAKEKLIAGFVANEPKNWRTSGDPKPWAEQWANEILPIARDAHTRVQLQHVHREERRPCLRQRRSSARSGPVTSTGQRK